MTDQRRSLLVAALGFLQLQPTQPELAPLHACLDNWSGLGAIVTGMGRQGYQLSLGEHWRNVWIAAFFKGDGGHDLTRVAGSAQEATPWGAVQQAAWQALNRHGQAA